MELLVVGALWVICGVFAAIVADAKGRSAGSWLVAGALFGFVALIAIAGMPS